MVQFWMPVDPVTGVFDAKQGRWVDSSIAPASSPAPAGNPYVPAGYVMQIAGNGSQDNVLFWGGAPLPYITQFCVPYFSGGWPYDPMLGEPGHTPQDWDGRI